jgi:hypothetical protein
MERLFSLLPSISKRSIVEAAEAAVVQTTEEAALEAPRAEDLAVQRALDEVLEYHRTHRPKNTTRNYEPKQREWKVSTTLCQYHLKLLADAARSIGLVQENGL